jgi:tRNA (guanine26-N2/guanine27-N2)-dimethyltransferase
MDTQLITEGEVKLEVPDLSRFKTAAGDYAPSLTPVFYNPRMEICRDISVSAAQILSNEIGGLKVCDPLAGVGARGIRYAKEVKGISKVLVNDYSIEAFELINRNVELNGLGSVIEARREDANALMWKNRGWFDFVDLDPFGSPAPFIDAACAALARQGVLAMTATDTAPLSGTHAAACLRRYGARPIKTEYCHESGVRILIGFTQRVAGKHDLALTPVFAHSTQHYFRVYLRARKGARRTDEVLKQLGYISHCSACGRRFLTRGIAPKPPAICECGNRLVHAGPMWLGKLMDKAFVDEVAGDLAVRNFKFKKQALALLYQCAEEAEGPPMFHDVHELARRTKHQPPKIAELIAKLKERGYFASRTHFSGTGFRTDAPMEEIIKIFKGA